MSKSNYELSIEAGYVPSYLSSTRIRNPLRYKLLKEWGIWGYKEEFDKRQVRVSEIYWEIKENDKMSFAEFHRLCCADMTPHIQTFHKWIGVHPFRVGGHYKGEVFLRFGEIIERFEGYKCLKE